MNVDIWRYLAPLRVMSERGQKRGRVEDIRDTPVPEGGSDGAQTSGFPSPFGTRPSSRVGNWGRLTYVDSEQSPWLLTFHGLH